jgi:hypothetical protein
MVGTVMFPTSARRHERSRCPDGAVEERLNDRLARSGRLHSGPKTIEAHPRRRGVAAPSGSQTQRHWHTGVERAARAVLAALRAVIDGATVRTGRYEPQLREPPRCVAYRENSRETTGPTRTRQSWRFQSRASTGSQTAKTTAAESHDIARLSSRPTPAVRGTRLVVERRATGGRRCCGLSESGSNGCGSSSQAVWSLRVVVPGGVRAERQPGCPAHLDGRTPRSRPSVGEGGRRRLSSVHGN